MNRNFIIGGVLAFSLIISGAGLPEVAAAQAVYSSTTTAAAAVPTAAQLRAAIAEVEALDGYDRFAGLSAAELAQTTPFAEEYLYLTNLVATGQVTLAQFSTTDQDYLRDLYRALTDAAKACRLIFGAQRPAAQNSTSAQNSANVQNSVTTQASTSATQTNISAQTSDSNTAQTSATSATSLITRRATATEESLAPAHQAASVLSLNPTSVSETVTTAAATPIEETVTTTSHTLALARPIRPQVS